MSNGECFFFTEMNSQEMGNNCGVKWSAERDSWKKCFDKKMPPWLKEYVWFKKSDHWLTPSLTRYVFFNSIIAKCGLFKLPWPEILHNNTISSYLQKYAIKKAKWQKWMILMHSNFPSLSTAHVIKLAGIIVKMLVGEKNRQGHAGDFPLMRLLRNVLGKIIILSCAKLENNKVAECTSRWLWEYKSYFSNLSLISIVAGEDFGLWDTFAKFWRSTRQCLKHFLRPISSKGQTSCAQKLKAFY